MEKENHIVRLVLDKAELPEEPDGALRFGPAGSYGIHTLQVEVGEGWQGRTITAVFQNRCGSACVEVLLSDGVITVPAEATAYPTDPQGIITFVGVDDKSRRVTCKLPYYVEATGCVCGDAPPPDPDKWQQYIEQVDDKLDEYFAGGNPDDVWTQTADGPGWAAPQGGGGGTGNYNNLSNKPRINGNELTGNKTWQQLGFPDVEAFATAAAQSAQEAQTAAGSASSAASAASGSATAAQGSASTASTKASEADTSAQDAAQSASAAEQSKTAAAQSASDASQSAQQAADSAGAADESATAASGSASAAASGAARAEAAADKIPMPAGSADAGKFLAANAAGDGYELKTGGGGGTTDYNALENKPSLNGVTMEGDKTAEDYGLATKEELPKQATDTEAGIAKFKPIAEQGNNVPASILPDGTVVVPPGGGSTSSWRKIAEIDVTEPVAEIVVSQDSEGNPFSLSDIVAFNTKNITIDETANGSIDFKLNDGILNMNLSVKSREGVYFKSEWVGYRVNTAGTSGFNAYHSAAGDAARRLLKSDPEKITRFSLKNAYAGNFTAGNLIVYGRD